MSATQVKDKERILLILPQAESCECALCLQGKWIKHLRSLLPEKESKELGDWYNALLDHEEDRAMTLYHFSERIREIVESVEAMVA